MLFFVIIVQILVSICQNLSDYYKGLLKSSVQKSVTIEPVKQKKSETKKKGADAMKKIKIMKLLKWFIVLTMVLCICSGFVVAGKGYSMYRNALDQMSLADKVESIQDKEHYTTFEELPEVYVNAVVSVEDHRFYNHPGIDLIAIGRAVFNDLRAGRFVEGGSTITQQLAKNLYFSQEKEMTRKAAEVFMAFDLERNYSKEEILELYVNTIYYGDGYYTVADASEGYFGKAPEEMSKYESTLLAGIPNAPSRYAPTKNPVLAEKRQMQVLRRMEDCGYFSTEEAETVAAQMVAIN